MLYHSEVVDNKLNVLLAAYESIEIPRNFESDQTKLQSHCLWKYTLSIKCYNLEIKSPLFVIQKGLTSTSLLLCLTSNFHAQKYSLKPLDNLEHLFLHRRRLLQHHDVQHGENG